MKLNDWRKQIQTKCLTYLLFFCLGMNIPDEDSESGQTGKYCLVAIGRLQVCMSDVSKNG